MKLSKSIFFAAAALVFAFSVPQPAEAAGKCDPPRKGMERPAWFAECEGMLQHLYRTQNPYGLPYPEFVTMYWQMYEVWSFPDRHPSLVGSACSPEGSIYINQSGYGQTCRGGRWQLGN